MAWIHHATSFCHLFIRGGVNLRNKKNEESERGRKKTNLSTHLICQLWKPHVSYVQIARNKVYFAWKLLIFISLDKKYEFSPVSRASFQKLLGFYLEWPTFWRSRFFLWSICKTAKSSIDSWEIFILWNFCGSERKKTAKLKQTPPTWKIEI